MYGVWSETPVSDGQENVGEVTMRVIGRKGFPFLLWHARGSVSSQYKAIYMSLLPNNHKSLSKNSDPNPKHQHHRYLILSLPTAYWVAHNH